MDDSTSNGSPDPIQGPKPAKHPGGRPSKYRQEYCSEIIDWFTTYPDFPTFEGYSNRILGVSMTRLYDWGRSHEEFRSSMERCSQIQKERLCNKALKNEYNSNFARFVAYNLGMSSESSAVQRIQSDINVQGSVSVNWIGTDSTTNQGKPK